MRASNLVQISTTIPKELKDMINVKGWKFNDLIRLGISTKEDNPQLIRRIKELEKQTDEYRSGNMRLQNIITKVCTELDELKEKMQGVDTR